MLSSVSQRGLLDTISIFFRFSINVHKHLRIQDMAVSMHTSFGFSLSRRHTNLKKNNNNKKKTDTFFLCLFFALPKPRESYYYYTLF